jgi:hypothetical protein
LTAAAALEESLKAEVEQLKASLASVQVNAEVDLSGVETVEEVAAAVEQPGEDDGGWGDEDAGWGGEELGDVEVAEDSAAPVQEETGGDGLVALQEELAAAAGVEQGLRD